MKHLISLAKKGQSWRLREQKSKSRSRSIFEEAAIPDFYKMGLLRNQERSLLVKA